MSHTHPEDMTRDEISELLGVVNHRTEDIRRETERVCDVVIEAVFGLAHNPYPPGSPEHEGFQRAADRVVSIIDAGLSEGEGVFGLEAAEFRRQFEEEWDRQMSDPDLSMESSDGHQGVV